MTPVVQRLNVLIAYMNEPERRALLFVAERIHKGRSQYGPLDPHDGRDWHQELGEELADALVYLGINHDANGRRHGDD